MKKNNSTLYVSPDCKNFQTNVRTSILIGSQALTEGLEENQEGEGELDEFNYGASYTFD